MGISLPFCGLLFSCVLMEFVMKKHTIFLLLISVVLSGCTSIFGGSSAPKMAYIGDLSNNRVSHAGDTIAYAKSDNDTDTIIYVFKGVDGKGGIHINRVLRTTRTGGQRTGLMGFFQNKSPDSTELVFNPDQTLLVSPGVHVVFIKSTPSELHYRVVMTAG